MCQVRDLLFAYLAPNADQNPETLPLVPLAARIVLGVKVRGNPSPTCPPFPLGTSVCKDFQGVTYEGTVTEHRGTLDDGSPEYYHVVYTDGDQEDVDAKECVDMTHMYNDTLRRTPRSIDVCGLLNQIFMSSTPLAKETVFTRAESLYGCDGPNVGHPFTGKYEIVQAIFTRHETHSGSRQYKFTISDSDDERITTSATLKDGSMIDQLQPGDRLRLEVVSASLRHAFLRVPSCVGLVKHTDEETVVNMLRHKPLAVIEISTLGFFHKDTQKFVRRPFAIDFVHMLHRHFHIATTGICAGLTLRCEMFGAYPLLFCAEDGVDEVLHHTSYPSIHPHMILLSVHPSTFPHTHTLQGACGQTMDK